MILSVVRFTDLNHGCGAAPSDKSLGYFQSSAARTGPGCVASLLKLKSAGRRVTDVPKLRRNELVQDFLYYPFPGETGT